MILKSERISTPLYRSEFRELTPERYPRPATNRYEARDVLKEHIHDRPSVVRKESHRALPQREKPIARAPRARRPLRGIVSRTYQAIEKSRGWIAGIDLRNLLDITDRSLHSAISDLRAKGSIVHRMADGLVNGAREYAVTGTPEDAPIYPGVPRKPCIGPAIREAMRAHGQPMTTTTIITLIADRFPGLKPVDISGRMSWLTRSGRVEVVSSGPGQRTQYRWIGGSE